MRGVRVVRDPLGILIDPYMDPVMGSQFGYVVVYGEDSPAVYDGETWHPIFEGDGSGWTSNQLEVLQGQMMKIAQAATTEPIYAELAKLLGMPVPETGGSIPIPADSTFEPAKVK